MRKKEKKNMAVNVDIKALLESGVHFGHKTSRWNPKAAPFIHSKRQDSHIIDLTKTVEALEVALPFLTKTASSRRPILFVGTKKQLKDLVKETAESVNQPYVTERWIGGILTNVDTISKQIKKLKNLERRLKSGDLEKRYSKLEVQRFEEEIEDLNRKYGGIKNMNGKPAALIVTDMITEANAIKEANALGIPVVAIADTNTDPNLVKFAIPGNDDAIKSVAILLDLFKQAVVEGQAEIKIADKPVSKEKEADKKDKK